MPYLEWLHLNFAKILGARKLDSVGYGVASFVWS